MLGHSGVGKTTYMAAMYGAMQHRHSFNGFTLTAGDDAVHTQLLYLNNCIQKGAYPDATAQRTTYNFTLHHEGEAFFPFEWVDYRGGALLENSSSVEKQRLIDDLKEADGILIFIDAVASFQGRRIVKELGHMTNLIKAAVGESEFPLPLMIVLTKADLLPRNGEEQALASVRNLVETISTSQHLIGSVIQVACGSRSMNVEQPVLQTIRLGIRIIAHLANARVDYANAMIDQYTKKASSFWGIVSDAFADETNLDKAHKEAAAALHIVNFVNPLSEPAEHLENYLHAVEMF